MILFLSSSAALAATLSVAADRSATYDTIGDALVIASSGDTIEVAAGTYPECVASGGMDLDIVGAGAADTVIDGSGLCTSTVEVGAGETVTLSGVTLTNTEGRGAYVAAASSVRLDEVDIVDSGTSDLYGAGAYVDGATLQVVGGEISGNEAREGGGIFATNSATIEIDGAAIADNVTATGGAGLDIQWYSTLVVRDSTITDNSAQGSGGGVLLYVADSAEFTDVVVEGNSSEGYGGGIEVEWYTTTTMERVQVTGNTAAGSGGGVGLWYYLSASILDSDISGNVAAGSGGGLLFYPSDTSAYDLDVTGTTVSDNTADGDGGGVYVGWGGAVHLQDNDIFSNSAGDSSTGGGVLVYVAEDTLLLRNHFCGNTAGSGGGASVQWTTVDSWRNNLFTGNAAAYGGGGHRYVDYDSETLHNSFLGNGASAWGGAYYGSWAYSPFEHNLVADTPSGAGIYADDAYTYANSPVSFSAWSDNEVVDAAGYFYVSDGDDGNIVVDDPGVLAWSTHLDCADIDARLAEDSPLRDAGDPEGATDLDGSVADIGAYGGPDAPVEDHDGDGADTTTDCLDVDAAVFPGAPETCDGRDEDCDGVVDDDAVDAVTWYVDADDDGFGAEPITRCEQPEGTVSEGGDCDDADPAAYPGADEVQDDGIDQDCDGEDAPAPGDTGDGGAEDGGAEDGGVADGGSADGGSAEGGGGDTGADGGAKEGCGCSGGGSASLWALLPLVGLVGRMRRRGRA